MQKILTFFYASGTGFSGQRFATEIVIQGLKNKGWQVLAVPTPALDRISEIDSDRKKVLQKLALSSKLLLVWLKGLAVAFSKTTIYVNLAQTKYGILRDGLPLLVRSFMPFQQTAVVSLHGSLFLDWKNDSWEAKLFKQISKAANYITILGPNHQNKLIALGISKEKIVCLDNTCLLAPVSETEVLQKHQTTLLSNKQQPLKVLYLSSLIETKGYVEFVEAISQLANYTSTPVEAILCGKITTSRIGDQISFDDNTQAKHWIESKIDQVNKSSAVRLHWINGATGDKKEKLFRLAQIFVLPSRYQVEAQPIAILEALASGCAVITTKVGEIPTTVSEQTALLLDDGSPEAIASAIKELADPDKRTQLALNGLKLFQERFSYHKHIEQWEQLLESTVSVTE